MTYTHFIFHLNGKDVKILLCVNELGKWVRIDFGHSLVAGSWKARALPPAKEKNEIRIQI